jgi:hypothetical protein
VQDDFINVSETQEENAANFLLLMATFSQRLAEIIEGVNKGSMLDLKPIFRACNYTHPLLNHSAKRLRNS